MNERAIARSFHVNNTVDSDNLAHCYTDCKPQVTNGRAHAYDGATYRISDNILTEMHTSTPENHEWSGGEMKAYIVLLFCFLLRLQPAMLRGEVQLKDRRLTDSRHVFTSARICHN